MVSGCWNLTLLHQLFSSLTYSCLFCLSRLQQQTRQHLNLIWNRIPQHQRNIHHDWLWYLVSACWVGWAWFDRVVPPHPEVAALARHVIWLPALAKCYFGDNFTWPPLQWLLVTYEYSAEILSLTSRTEYEWEYFNVSDRKIMVPE